MVGSIPTPVATLGCRPTVGHRFLVPAIRVRIPAPHPRAGRSLMAGSLFRNQVAAGSIPVAGSTRFHRLAVQDAGLSSRSRGFKSRWKHHTSVSSSSAQDTCLSRRQPGFKSPYRPRSSSAHSALAEVNKRVELPLGDVTQRTEYLATNQAVGGSIPLIPSTPCKLTW